MEENGINGKTGEKEKDIPGNGELVQVKADPFKRYKIGKQTLLVIIWVCIGLAGEIVGPTLVDLKDRLGVNYEEVARVLIGKSIGMLGGAIIGGFLNERFYAQVDLLMVISLAGMAAAAIVVPFSRTVPLTGAMFALNGFTEGIINTGGNAMVMHLWGEDSAPPMHSLHFGFGFGALLAPQIARPFLSPDNEDDVVSNVTTMPPTAMPEDLSRIEIPYGIIGGLIFLFTLILFGFYIRGPPPGFKMHKPVTKLKDMVSPASCTGGLVCYGVQLFAILFFYFIQAAGGERAYGRFLFSFAVESDVKMKKADASNLQTAFWASFTAGRLLGVPISKFVPVRYMILGDLIGLIVTSIILAIFAYYQVMVLWVFSCLMGLFIAVFFPNGMSWANLQMQMNSMGIMVLMVGVSCGGFIYQYLTGFLFEKEARNLMYVMLGYAILNMIIFIIMEVIVLIQKRTVGNREKLENNNDVQIAVVYKS